MTTYNSYAEAKIANPEKEIIRFDKQDELKAVGNGELSAYLATWTRCNPADHCMTVEKFLADGHKFVEGDVYLNSNGRTLGVVNIPEHNNKRSTIDCNLYILRAAALENIPTETPEEKEVLDSIESAGEVEWKNGDECVYMSHKVIHQFIGADPKREGYGYIQATGYEVNFVELSKLSKPETKQQREDRERLEAAYDLYLAFWSASKSSIILESYDEFSSQGNSDLKHFLAVVDKTNYRKGVN